MEGRVVLVAEVARDHELTLVGDRYLCSCGTPLATKGFIATYPEQNKDELANVANVFAMHMLHAGLAKFRDALNEVLK